jgi:HSP20 family protein
VKGREPVDEVRRSRWREGPAGVEEEAAMALTVRRSRLPEVWPFAGRHFEWPDWMRTEMDRLFADDLISVEEFRDGDEYVVRAEIPGVDPDKDIEVSVVDRVLRIRADKREETRTDEQDGFRSEFRYGTFSRAVELPAGATADDVKASYTDGVLEVRVRLDEVEAKATKIPIGRR